MEKEAKNISLKNSSPLFSQLGKLENRMIFSDEDANAEVLNLENKTKNVFSKTKSNTSSSTKKQYNYKFASADFGGDNFSDYAVLKNNELEIIYYHQDQFQVFGSYQFSNSQDAIFSVRSKNMGKAMLGSLCKKQNQIFLFDKKGQLHADFPLAGTTQFQLLNLFSDDKNSVLVADGNQVVVYSMW